MQQCRMPLRPYPREPRSTGVRRTPVAADVAMRSVVDSDLDALFDQMRDPVPDCQGTFRNPLTESAT